MAGKVGRPPLRIEKAMQWIRDDYVISKKPGDRLPSEDDLSKHYAVSRATIRGALEGLEKAHLVHRKKASGTFVSRFAVRAKELVQKSVGISFSKSYRALTAKYLAAQLEGFRFGLMRVQVNVNLAGYDWRFIRNDAEPADFFRSPDIVAIALFEPHRRQDLDSIKSLNKPMIAIDYDCTADGITSVVYDNDDAGRLLARRLDRLDHKRVVALFEDIEKPLENQDQAWRGRRDGFLSEWEKLVGVEPKIIPMDERIYKEEYVSAIIELLRKPVAERPTALIAPSESVANSLLIAVSEFGLTVPKDISIVAFADADTYSDMTAVRFDHEELGGEAGDYMVSMLANPEAISDSARLIKVKTRYVAGKTHGKAPDSIRAMGR